MEQFEQFNEIFDLVISNITELREVAEKIRERMDEIVDACETMEGEL